MRASFLVLALPLVALAQTVKGPGRGPVVRVAQGQLRGARLQRGPDAPLRTLYAFRGVPYARPPVGRLRFQDPEEAQAWTGIRNATSYGPNCIQKHLGTGNVSGEEDCLYLNVFTANPPGTWPRVRRPVIVYIHGGAFVMLSGDADVNLPDPLLRQGVVFVTLNYRLGIMGFLNTEDAQAPGNAALKDQALALRWVQTNIAAFGGDANQVTIMGHSSGGASVHLHMMSPISKGLFRRAVAVSGTALFPAARSAQPRRSALAIRQLFARACPDAAPDAIVACLQQVDARDLVFNQENVPREQFENYFLKNPFLPTVETPGATRTPFLTAEPEQLLREGRFTKDVPFLTGYTSAEGIILLVGLLENSSLWAEIDDNFLEIFRSYMPPGLRTRDAVLRMRNFYLGDRSLRDANQNLDTLQRFVQMYTDVAIAVDVVSSARMMADQGAAVYLYQFSRDGPMAFLKKDLFNLSFVSGVIHGDDMAYLFDFTNQTTGEPLPIPPSEVPLRERQAKLFTNFAKTGNPTPQGSGLERWPLFTAPQEEYMDMDQQLRVHPRALGDRIAFWRQLAAEQQTNSRRNVR